MAAHLSPDEVQRIASFMGYGRSTAPVWFIGLEEGLGRASDGDAMFNLTARGTFRAEMDLVEAHLLLRAGGRTIDIETKQAFTQVWTWMAKLMRAHEGNRDWSSISAAKSYVRGWLGRGNGETFLTELSPWPRRRLADRPLHAALGLSGKEADELVRRRSGSLAELHGQHRPALTICYGYPHESKFGSLLGVQTWEPIADRVKASPDRRVLLLPFFGLGWMRSTIVDALLARQLIGPQSPAARSQ